MDVGVVAVVHDGAEDDARLRARDLGRVRARARARARARVRVRVRVRVGAGARMAASTIFLSMTEASAGSCIASCVSPCTTDRPAARVSSSAACSSSAVVS